MKIFVTGISTDVGKTIVSAILTEALQADYWKPIQSGDLHLTDTDKVRDLVSNNKTRFFDSAYALQTPASPHLAAKIDGIEIELSKINCPNTDNHLVVEGAGGLMVPMNDTDCVIDLIKDDYQVILVSRHYLGSINHTLLSIMALENRGVKIAGIIFSGNENKATEEIIAKKTKISVLGRINEEPFFDKEIIQKYARQFEPVLQSTFLVSETTTSSL